MLDLFQEGVCFFNKHIAFLHLRWKPFNFIFTLNNISAPPVSTAQYIIPRNEWVSI